MLPPPPFVSGAWPVVGHLPEMLRERNALFRRGFAEHGNVFALKLGPQAVAVVTGAAFNREFYTQTDKTLDMTQSYAFLKHAFGEVLFTASRADYYNQRPILQEVFRRERMVAYIAAMDLEVQAWLDSLGEQGEVNLTQAMLTLAQHIAGRAFIGEHYALELGAGFWPQYEHISRSLDVVLPSDWPLPKFIRRDRARVKIQAIMEGVIATRRQHPERYDDLIATLLTTPLKDGSHLNSEQIVNIFIGLIFAGHETTAGQAAWSLAHLLQHPDYLARVRAEIDTHVTPEQPVTGPLLSRLTHVYWAIDETTRLTPSADTQLRTVLEPLALGDHMVPTGWRVMVSAATSHHLNEAFAQPDCYDPLRYSPERGEGKDAYAIVGFGGGVHKCTGMNFAKNEMAVIIARFFQRFEAQLVSTDVRVITGNGANHPSEIRVRYRRR